MQAMGYLDCRSSNPLGTSKILIEDVHPITLIHQSIAPTSS